MNRTLPRLPQRIMATCGIVLLSLVLQAAEAADPILPSNPDYIGEIRRGPDGRLVATPPSTNASNSNSADDTQPRTLRVGKFQPYTSIAAAARDARNGDTVEIEAGDYVGDVAIWAQDKLTIRGVGGRARLIANGRHVERKGIWIIRGGLITVENIEFSGAKVEHKNGAGIRFEKGHLILRNCAFFDNENGIMSHNDEATELDIENSEFARNGYGDGQTHNIYVGSIKRFRMTGSYSHHANVGQLVKSRAKETYLLYNRLTDESGRASYEIDLPSGGIAYVIGNIIQQSATTENGHMISFGVEGYKWKTNELYLINNTIIDNRMANGRFLLIKPGELKIRAINNIVFGPDKFRSPEHQNIENNSEFSNNLQSQASDFVNMHNYDYTLSSISHLIGKITNPGYANKFSLLPEREYRHPLQTRSLGATPSNPGALQKK